MQRLNDTMMKSEIQLNLKIHSDMDEAVDDCCDKVFAIIEIVDEEDEDSWYPPSVLSGGTHSLTHLLTHSLTHSLTKDIRVQAVNARIFCAATSPRDRG